MKKYKIEIWQHHSVTETFESNNIENIVDYFNEEWRFSYDVGWCTFYLYEDGKELNTREKVNLIIE